MFIHALLSVCIGVYVLQWVQAWASSPVLFITEPATLCSSGPVLFFLQSHPHLLLLQGFLQVF